MKEQVKIRIIKGEGKWYEKFIGKTFLVKSIFENKTYIIRNYRTILRTVDKEDAEIIKG